MRKFGLVIIMVLPFLSEL